MTKKQFGELIRTARQAKNLSQAKLGRVARTSAAFICQIEGAERVPSDRVARRLATALGLDWQEIMRIAYRLRSPDSDGLFTQTPTPSTPSIYETPAIRALLLQVAALNLTERDLEALVRNWNNDVTMLVELIKSRRR